MNELETIRLVLAKTARRRRLAHALMGLWKGALTGAVLLLVTLGIYKLAPIPPEALYGVAGAAVLCVVVGFVWGWSRSVTLMDTARWVDSKKHFQERLSTALEMAESRMDDHWKNLVVADAAARLKEVDAKQLLPISLTKASRWALACLLVTACLGFVPEYRTKAYVQKKKDAEIIKETGKQLVELTRRTLEQRPPAMEPAQKALNDVNQLGEHFAKGQLSRGDALKDLASAMQKLKDETKDMRQNQAFKALDKAAKAASKGSSQSSADMQKQMDALQQQMQNQNSNPDALDKLKKDIDKAQEAAASLGKMDQKSREEAEKRLQAQLADLAKEAHEMGMNLPQLDEAIAALANAQPDQVLKDLQMAEIELEKLRDMAKSLEKLQMQMDKLGKDLAEQLKNGQVEAAQSTLAKMQQELDKQSLTPEQLKKMMEQVAAAQKPGEEYGEAGKHLKEATKKMSEGDKTAAKESLAAASKELGKMVSEMGDAQSILQSLEALQQAQMAIGNGQSWANMPQKGRGKGKGKGEGEESSGGGFGTWHDEESWMYPEFKDKWDNNGQAQQQGLDSRSTKDKDAALADNLLATKVKGQMTPGGPMPSITMKGVSIKGNSKVQIQEMVGAAQSDAQGALSQDQVPRAYQGAVKDYFNDLK
jgi:hypothetical protein